ncbi:urease accessory protein [Loktanella fryxellensis]|uniref:Urease accessory protein UreF n=1 Tax=Loktanella fryxellensis TaxID=245187 RepID=A0A1H8CLU0_9RHOB|nr:urease accessory UreF family protein [Loktanella fryxellensis]SEM96000.1 urease accessory protein [Loktanella fryxellensis]
MHIDRHLPVTPDDGLLTLMQWLSPGFPLGTFGYSHGLEQAIADHNIRHADDLGDWLHTVMTDGTGRTDAILLAEAYRHDDPACIDALARALSPARERLLETSAQGEAFCQTVNAVWGTTLPPLCLPVAVGAAARMQGIALTPTLQTYLFAFAAGLVSAAQRAMPLGQTRAQALLLRVAPTCRTLAAGAVDWTLDDIGTSAFMAEIAAMRHETLQPRIFRS